MFLSETIKWKANACFFFLALDEKSHLEVLGVNGFIIFKCT